MTNKSFSRGIETLRAEVSMVFVGNTEHNVAYMLKYTDLFDERSAQFHDSAFLDRVHFYILGWEMDIIRGEMFSFGYGFVVDYLAEILRNMRNYDYSQSYKKHFELFSNILTRDRDSIHKTFSGLMKILFLLLNLDIQIFQIKTLEEEQYLNIYYKHSTKGTQQEEKLEEIKKEMVSAGINFMWKFDDTGAIHTRHIQLNNGWKISLDTVPEYVINECNQIINESQ